jgi:YD repeat-containing protein
MNSVPILTLQFVQNQSSSKLFTNDTINTVKNFGYLSTNHFQQTQTEEFDSKGQSIKEKVVFPKDYPNRSLATSGDGLSIRKLADTNMFVPIEVLQIKRIGSTDYVMGGSINLYRTDRPLLSKIYRLKIAAPLPLSSFVPSTINGSGTFVKDANYEEYISFNKYDLFGNVIEMQKKDDAKVTLIYDYKNIHPIAEVMNADSGSVAFTSFEADGTGNWVITNDGFTGTNSYQLSSGSITKTGLSSGSVYWLSYWTKNASPFSITGTQGSAILSKQLGNWRCYTHKITGVSQIVLSGTGILDEIRFQPDGAKMSTWCIEPLVGPISHCSNNNIVMYYEYDALGRLTLIRDQNKNILKKADYQFGQTE